MIRRKLVAVAAVVLAAALPAAAGGADCNAAQTASNTQVQKEQAQEQAKEKCTESTQTCLDYMVTHAKDRGWVGIEMESDEALGTLTISYVEPDSPAKRAGLQPGDVLAALNGIRFSDENREVMQAAHQKMKAGATVTYSILRGGHEQEVAVTLGEIPEIVLAKWIGRHMLEHASGTAVAQK